MNIAHLMLRHAASRPDQVALVEPGRKITYRELDEASARGAALLRANGIATGSRVVVFVPLSIDLYVVLTALFRIGAAAVVIDPGAGRDHVKACCGIASPDAMIAIPKAHLLRLSNPAIRNIRKHFVVGGWAPFAVRWSKCHVHAPDSVVHDAQPESAALLTFTSGSTGTPKCAVRTHGLLAAQHAALEESIELQPGEIDFATLPIFALANLASGLTTVLADSRIAPVTRCTAAPAALIQLLATRPSLEKVYTGGAPIFYSLVDFVAQAQPRAKIVALYGSTEAEPIAHLLYSEICAAMRARTRAGAGLPAGTPVPQVSLRIIRNHTGNPLPQLSSDQLDELTLPANQVGEIIVTGPHVLAGYLNGVGDEQTKIRVEPTIWHRTGDAGYLDDTGMLWLVGRAGAGIIDSNGAVYPLQVEAAAKEVFPDIRCALVQLHGVRTLLVEKASVDREDCRQKLLDNLQPLHIERVEFVETIPMDRRHKSKIDYGRLNVLVRELEQHVSRQ